MDNKTVFKKSTELFRPTAYRKLLLSLTLYYRETHMKSYRTLAFLVAATSLTAGIFLVTTCAYWYFTTGIKVHAAFHK